MARFLKGIFYLLPVAAVVFFWFKPSLLTGRHLLFPARASNPAPAARPGPDQEADKKISPPDHEVLPSEVEQSCVKYYDRDTCIQHLLTCGTPCLVALPKPDRERILKDYEQLKGERGLPNLPEIPQGLPDGN
jgi:hypothetical protein